MAKTKTATTTDNATTAETTEKKAKAKSGSSIPAQAKTLVQAVYDEGLANTAESFGDDFTQIVIKNSTWEWLVKLVGEITETQTKGLSSALQLDKAQAERNAIFVRAQIVNGEFTFASADDEKKASALTAKITRLKNEIAKAKETEKAKSEGETEEEETEEEE